MILPRRLPTGLARVSVIIPCYNYARYLSECLTTVLAQPGVEVSVLIIDDGSSDDTPAVAQALAAHDSRVEFRQHLQNRGHIATYNEGFAWASGDYTVLLSADDLLVPGALQRATALMQSNPSVGFVYGRTVFLRAGRPSQGPQVSGAGQRMWTGAEWLERRCRSSNNCISSPEVVLRTSLVKKLGGFDPALPHTADLEYWMRFAVYADVGYVRRAHQAFYRIHPDSMLRQNYSAPMLDLHHRKAAFDALFRDHGDVIPEADRLHDLANKAMARQALWGACRAYDRGRTETAPVDEMVQFALDTYPEATSLREFSGLRWRRRLGTRACPLLQPLLVVPILRRLREELAWLSVQRRGV